MVKKLGDDAENNTVVASANSKYCRAVIRPTVDGHIQTLAII